MIKSIYTICFTILQIQSTFSQEDINSLGIYEIFLDDQWVTPTSGTPPISLNPELFNSTFISEINYPKQARRMGIEGQTFITIKIDENGNTFDQ